MANVLDSLKLKLYIVSVAKYTTDKIYGKTKEDFEKEVDDMPDSEFAEMLEVGECVHEEFEEGGRWSNYETKVYRHWHDGKHVYVMVEKEVPATESQEGGDFDEPSIEIVYPHKVETIVYKLGPQDGVIAKGRAKK